MKLEQFDFYLPEELIAQTPLLKRDTSKLLCIDKKENNYEHKTFSDIIDYFEAGDTLVLNNTRVMPARLYGQKKDTGAAIEVLLLKNEVDNIWECLVKPAKRIKIGSVVSFGDGIMEAICTRVLDDGFRYFEFKYEGIFQERLDELGTMPLPPYIKEKLQDKERYQTIYSKINGSSAAPTAGLHFTKELIASIEGKGVQIEYLTLHVGLGTFRPVKVEEVTEHVMHSEHYVIDEATAQRLNKAKNDGKKIIAVGTTTVRTLESAVNSDNQLEKLEDDTSIFIYPPYNFKFVDSIITNFHLPQSTLIMMISAFAGKDKVFSAYNEAIKNEYRFFSFGDSMFIDKDL